MIRSINSLCLCLLMVAPAMAQESFRVELGRDGETIGDMRPVFLTFESRPMPAISPSEVARRYHRLFRTSDEPEVRIDALNRLSNIRDRSGEDVGLSPAEEEQVYSEAISSYESILARGSYGGRLDELLYQMAKAHALTGQQEPSIQRLKQLVGLYPESPLVPEARFRLAESAFAAGQYAEAESGYRQLIESDDSGEFSAKARYMLGWSQFKQGPSAWDRASATFVEVLDEFLPQEQSLESVRESSVDTIDDTFRVLALMAARNSGPQTLISWLDIERPRPWEHLLFDRLADYYAILGETKSSVAANRAFIEYSPNHHSIPAFRLQVVDVWQAAGDAERVRAARARFVESYSEDSAYANLNADQQDKWRSYSRRLADYHYDLGTRSVERGRVASAESAFARAAVYYEGLASRVGRTGEVLRLAGDARLQAGDAGNALANFRKAAYEAPGYSEAADAAWAAVTLLRDGVNQQPKTPAFRPALQDLSDEANRFTGRFSGDTRSSGLMADLAARWLTAGDHELALHYASQVLTARVASPEEQYAAWQVTARIRQKEGDYGLAERAWNQALDLAESDQIKGVTGEQLAAIRGQLATAVYRQGEVAASNGRLAEAVGHFRRVDSVLPGSEIAIRARYDAANTLLKASDWTAAVVDLQEFRTDHPQHELAAGISEKLVHAWMQSDQPTQAASELLQAADNHANPWQLKLRAAELLSEAGNLAERNALYRDYLATGPKAGDGSEHEQLQIFRYRLVETGDDPDGWRQALVQAELDSAWHSAATLEWASRSSLVLGARAAAAFTSISLSQPLAQSLDRKQKALETARQRFLDAEALGGERVLSESLFRRAELYRGLAKDLMSSAAPADLNELEAMQYQMLLEEEAYPFEEKAIELHTANHRRITSEGYDAWIGRSLGVLAELHPGRYERSVKWLSWNMESNDGV
ncbi:outer membrane protein assembly factor BamD [Marinobacter sp. BW6]|uniref:tetratricopeptide repeat protein n=1 Tax=Marinobacter sp. BW6 TaxID=2592624 RepID=UPI0011DED1C0|nr:outer membrane protein assembly factor BamD [Marinobacter sp. BW6]TYC62689.1 outer membrane protein assembly factor BamD [Marinobacter sp. BW6]